ncbi:FtsX-like permease family protein [Streptomyces sp. AM 4-1-1]|uniref:ABC transporter permease n=1 Tax=Streptomyces sp. AM 4-1-1 TaxID=3028710 RepID=UPI0023B970E3|nr:FtsX-like permease family protein [Streptomyces sp. AM 4-1-1]WEH36475.1 FtsX-like permease family protein [Streptomyces sp. AM 4-1-1]
MAERSGAEPTADARAGSRRASAFLARRSLRVQRRAWAAVFAATAAAAALLGAFAFVIGSVLLAQPPVDRYAGADAVVAADQKVTYTVKPWGSEPRTVTAYLPERARLDRSLLAKVRAVDGVANAVVDDSVPVALGDDGSAAVGRSWPSAVLTPYELTEGRAPRTPGEVVVDASLVPAGTRPGDPVRLQVGGAARAYTVSGVAHTGHRGAGAPAVFFTEQRLTALAGHPGTVDTIGVVAEQGVSSGALNSALRDALPSDTATGRDVRVLTGAGRGQAEWLDAIGGRNELAQLLAAVTGTVVMVALLVIASTLSQAIHQRSAELALLRAVGASPRQIKSAIGREVTRVALAAAVLGGVGCVPLGLMMRSLLTSDALPLPVPVWLPFAAGGAAVLVVALVARPVAALAARGITRLRPAAALGAARTSEPAAPGRFRTITGAVLAFAGIGSAGVATAQGGQAAAAAASGAAASLVIAVALLGPWIARGAMRVLGVPVRRLGGVAGFLADRTATAHTRRLGAAITPIVLVVAFVCVQLAAGTTLERAADRQAAAALRADLVATGPAAGFPAEAVAAVRKAPGVAAATSVMRSAVVLAHRELGDPKLERLPVLGVSADQLTGVLDPRVTSGDLRNLTGSSTIAVGEERAHSLGVGIGDTVELRLGDGTETEPRVVAVYERSLGLGEFMLPRTALTGHVSAPGDERVLIGSTGPDTAEAVRKALAPYSGVRVRAAVPDDVRTSLSTSEQDDALIIIGVGVIGGFALLAVVSTLTLITVGRKDELRLLRLVGAGRRQLTRMLFLETGLVAVAGLVIGTVVAAIPLSAFAVSMAGTAPYMPPVQYGVLAGAVIVAAAAGTLLPASAARRRRINA